MSKLEEQELSFPKPHLNITITDYFYGAAKGIHELDILSNNETDYNQNSSADQTIINSVIQLRPAEVKTIRYANIAPHSNFDQIKFKNIIT